MNKENETQQKTINYKLLNEIENFKNNFKLIHVYQITDIKFNHVVLNNHLIIDKKDILGDNLKIGNIIYNLIMNSFKYNNLLENIYLKSYDFN